MTPLLQCYINSSIEYVKWSFNEGSGENQLSYNSTAPLLFFGLLQTIASATTGAGASSETYTVDFNTATNRVDVTATGAVILTWYNSLHHYLGFSTQATPSATTHTGDLICKGAYVPLSLDWDAPSPAEHTKLLEFRAGRSLAQSWVHTKVFDMKIKGNTPDITAQLQGPLLGGCLFRAWRNYDPTLSGYKYGTAAADMTGHIDASVVRVKSIRTIGASEALTEVVLECQTSQNLY